MTLTYNCPQCYDDCYNTLFDDLTDVEEGSTEDFICESCGCEFEITFNAPTVHITKRGIESIEGPQE